MLDQCCVSDTKGHDLDRILAPLPLTICVHLIHVYLVDSGVQMCVKCLAVVVFELY